MHGLWLLLTWFPTFDGAEELEFFETRIRPVLVERCYRCHNSVDQRSNDLALDHREGLLRGGQRGPAVVPHEPDVSLLVHAIRHDPGAPRMPRDEPRLDPDEVEDFIQWIRRGALDPRDTVPTAKDLAEETSWEQVRQRRSAWWSFQPVMRPAVPLSRDQRWPLNEIDQFVIAALAGHELEPAPPASDATLLRRASLIVTGLPPSTGELETFLGDRSPDAYERAIDRLLTSPRFGERWARHWMDLFRYAESHGSEGDPAIPEAYRYRDYLREALNADVPYDRLIREHLAGDLLEPRVDPETGINQAAIGTAHFRFVQHGYAPTDPLEEQVRFTDNQIDVVTKSVLGLTVSCARCHDHKFDPVSQRDYTALYGIFASARPGLRTVDAPHLDQKIEATLDRLKQSIRERLADSWRTAAQGLTDRLMQAPAATPKGEKPAVESPIQSAVDEAASRGKAQPLYAWVSLRDVPAESFTRRWAETVAEHRASLERLAQWYQAGSRLWDLGGPEAATWFSHGPGLRQSTASPPGSFAVLPDGDRILDTVYPAGVYSHLLSSKHSAVFTSPNFDVDFESLWIRVAGGGGARARYSMQHYPRVSGPVYKSHGLSSTEPRWLHWNMTYWNGDRAYLEVATNADLPVEAGRQQRSWWGITEVIACDPGMETPREEPAEFTRPLFEAAPDALSSAAQLAEAYEHALIAVVERWRDGSLSDSDARFLGAFVRLGLLPAHRSQLPELEDLVDQYRQLEQKLRVPTRAPGLLPGPRIEQRLYARGDHRRPAEREPHHFLTFLDDGEYTAERDGRLQLADDLVDPDNPLTARVAVNRIWQWVFGRGIVVTTDNFGLLGEKPTHPELLDWLASEFVESGWSIRKLLRKMVTSRTFRQGATEASRQADPENLWLSRMAPRRLCGEAIRDSMLAVSGRLEEARSGASVGERTPRRSLYVSVRRNSLSPFLTVFDAPEPHSTTGRRAITNTPAQALALMNDPLVIEAARHWAGRILADPELETAPARVQRMFAEALGRPASTGELRRALQLVEGTRARRERARADVHRLEGEIAYRQQAVDRMLAAARDRVRTARGVSGTQPEALPRPIARWDFDDGLRDSEGSMHGEAVGKPRVEDGRLVLDGESYVLTQPFARDLHAKTLEAWIELDGLEQKAGGVLTVQTTDGNLFDSIVYAERRPGEWMAGSDSFRRTQDVGGLAETSQGVVHMAITYATDGTITVYRDGQQYGEPYRSSGPLEYSAGRAQALLGMRHGTRSRRTARIRGAIEQAQLYDRALSAEELAATASGDPNFVPRRELLAALDSKQLEEKDRIERTLTRLRRELVSHSAPEGDDDDDLRAPWSALAHSLFNLKEFLYLR